MKGIDIDIELTETVSTLAENAMAHGGTLCFCQACTINLVRAFAADVIATREDLGGPHSKGSKIGAGDVGVPLLGAACALFIGKTRGDRASWFEMCDRAFSYSLDLLDVNEDDLECKIKQN